MGFWDSASDILMQFGVTGDTAIATARALAAPTDENIQAVETAFLAIGATPPPELMEMLWGRYYSSISDNPVYTATKFSDYTPYILGGAGVLLLLMILKRRG